MSTFEFEAQPWQAEHEGVVSQSGREAVRRSLFPLAYSIPDDPNHQRYKTIEYRLPATALVREIAEDLKRGERAHFLIELADWGIAAGEIFAETSALVGLLSIGAPVLGMLGTFLALGMPYAEINKELAVRWSRTGLSRGSQSDGSWPRSRSTMPVIPSAAAASRVAR